MLLQEVLRGSGLASNKNMAVTKDVSSCSVTHSGSWGEIVRALKNSGLQFNLK